LMCVWRLFVFFLALLISSLLVIVREVDLLSHTHYCRCNP
jgi:hypothetical protein